jgi:hypothetical protein
MKRPVLQLNRSPLPYLHVVPLPVDVLGRVIEKIIGVRVPLQVQVGDRDYRFEPLKVVHLAAPRPASADAVVHGDHVACLPQGDVDNPSVDDTRLSNRHAP